ncbi:MAG: hypothetical protein CM1200mP27_01570 [Chloroflexota bacterium]|nr:MAG: hypothetical protein CM1200mP27_01570 [Chloroflexota bacterium]
MVLGSGHCLRYWEEPCFSSKDGDLRGQVVNGTEGSVIPDSLSVLMLITGLDGRYQVADKQLPMLKVGSSLKMFK